MNRVKALVIPVALCLFPGFAWQSVADGQDRSPVPRTSQSAQTSAQALAELRKIGGVLIHYDDRRPGRPVILVDFTNHPQFKEDWLRHLAGFPELATLGLGGTPLTDQGMKYLKDLQELDTLVLSGTKITDKGLAELRNLKRLRHLSVTETAVTASDGTPECAWHQWSDQAPCRPLQ